MPAGPAPTMASLSLVMKGPFVSRYAASPLLDNRTGASSRAEGSAGTIGDGLRKARQGLAHGTVGQRRERRHGVVRPGVSEVEGRVRRLVLAQLGQLGVQKCGVFTG